VSAAVNVLGLLADGWDVRTDRMLYARYERERFSGGVNLSAQARNREIDAKVYVFRPAKMLIVSPRTLDRMRLRDMVITGTVSV